MKIITQLTLAIIFLMLPLPGGSQPEDAPAKHASEAPMTPEDRAISITSDEDLSPEEKRARLQPMANANPESGIIWSAYGEALMDSGQDSTAREAFLRASENDPLLYTPWLRLGILAKRGDPRPDYKQAIEYFEMALDAGAPEAAALNELAVSLALSGKMQEAAERWEQAIQKDTEWGVLYNNLFKAALALGDDELIERHLQDAIDAERYDERAILNLGQHYTEEGEPERAITIYEQALAAHPSSAELAFWKARALEEADFPEQARLTYQQAGELASVQNDFVLGQNVEFALFRLENPEEEERFQRLREIVLTRYESMEERQKRLPRAIRGLDALIERTPDFWNGYYLRAKANRLLDNREAARSDLEKALELEPGEPNSTMELALLERDDLSMERAADLAASAVENAPRDPLFALQAGLIFIDAQQCEKAWEMQRKAVKMIGEANAAVLTDQLEARCAE